MIVQVFYILTDLLLVPSIIEEGVLKPLTVIMNLSVSFSVLSMFTSRVLKLYC